MKLLLWTCSELQKHAQLCVPPQPAHPNFKFLGIYNEQIMNLLDPNQRNLLIREDVKSGLYVENLTKEPVSMMKDVTQVLMKVAMTGIAKQKWSKNSSYSAY